MWFIYEALIPSENSAWHNFYLSMHVHWRHMEDHVLYNSRNNLAPYYLSGSCVFVFICVICVHVFTSFFQYLFKVEINP